MVRSRRGFSMARGMSAILLPMLLFAFPEAPSAAPPSTRAALAGDCDGDGTVSIGEVQKAINMFLGIENWGQVLPLTPPSPLSPASMQDLTPTRVLPLTPPSPPPPASMQDLTPIRAPACGVDANADETVSIGEVQRVINGFLGLIPVFTIQASSGPGGTVEPSGTISAAQGSSQTFTLVPDLGMAVDDVLVDSVSVGALPSYTFEEIQADHTLTASFTPSCASPQITTPPKSQEVVQGATATLAVEATGTAPLCHLWYRGESGDEGHPIPEATQPSYTTPPLHESTPFWVRVSNACGHVDSPTAVVTVAPVPVHSLTVTLGEGVTGTPSSNAVYPEGTVVEFAYAPLACFGGLVVLLDGLPAGNGGTVTMDSPHALDATAVPLSHTIEASAGTGGTITPAGSVRVVCGADLAFSIAPEGGYLISDVLVDGASVGPVDAYTFGEVVSDHTIAASFTQVPTFTLAVTLGEGVAGTPATTGTYPQGAVVDYAFAPASSCYQSLDVRLDGSPAPPSGSVTMDGDHGLTATASPVTYTIAASAGTGGAISPSGTVSVACGSSALFTVSPNSGHAIEDLKVDGSSVGALPSYTFPDIHADHTIHATFEASTYTVTFVAGPGGTLSGTTPQTVPHGGSTTPVTAIPDGENVFVNWTGTGGYSSNEKTLTITNVTKDMTLTANFQVDPEVQKDGAAQAFIDGIPQSKDSQSPTPWYDASANRYNFTVLTKTNTHDRDDDTGAMYDPVAVIKPWLEGLLFSSLPAGDYDDDGAVNSSDPTPLGF